MSRIIATFLFGSALVLSNNAIAQLQLTPMNGWQAFEILDQNENISSISDSGYGNSATRGTYDGLGVYQSAANTLSIRVNHETSNAAISRVDVNRNKLIQGIRSTIDNGATSFPIGIKTGMGYAYDAIYDGTYHAVTNSNPVASGTAGVASYGTANFDRFCSGTSYRTNGFGAGRGFADSMYLTGEEVSGGKFYALENATSDLWEVDSLGLGNWENAALMDTGNSTHVALVLMSDNGTSPGDYLQMYVGEKNVDVNGDGSIDFLERNGLRGGSVYYFDPDGAVNSDDLPDGQYTGIWSSSTNGALRETKLEDIHTNPLNGAQAVFADQTDGVYILDQNLIFNGSGLDLAQSTAVITQIDDDDVAPLGAPDNLTWSANGRIYVQEDGDGNDLYVMDADGLNLTQIAHAFSEPSGITDISEFVGYEPGSVFLSSIQGNGSSGAQLTLLISPAAQQSIPEPLAGGIALTMLGSMMFRRRRRQQHV